MKKKLNPRIHSRNRPMLAKFGIVHPAVWALQMHAEARDLCVGKEIEWPNGNKPIDQEWYSTTREKPQRFSSFAYEFISYDLVLEGWFEMPSNALEEERRYLEECAPLIRSLLAECETAAVKDHNSEILKLVAKARDYVAAHTDAILYRFKECGISTPSKEPTATWHSKPSVFVGDWFPVS